ncbi:acyl-CoA/acyl-ACP dehydrogenase [Amycolatopsis sp. K13G38]|uniref:Acyl-CoA/acyl-ACP dehydrogenase n=1 Tax=Amycolatopsis acididurans TaxID=2724524 RepID=A0ABX1J252_9PSEU|nr:acyl-CoA dehydrogenase family protein [Amycolatopsis acididurans]NKQ52430.1 acyl-CoA/acyl-ACP dehydrogenase [Amycolatopsis acididurans]
MTDQDLVVDTVRDILTAHEPFDLSPDRPWNAALWQTLAGTGMTGVGLPEAQGGSGGSPADAVAVVATLAEGAAAVPAAESLLVAGPSLVDAGVPLPDMTEPLTIVCGDTLTATGSGTLRLTGTAADVPWGTVARRAVVLATTNGGTALGVADLPRPRSVRRNLAGEPLGFVEFDGVEMSAAGLAPAAADVVRARFALARAVQLSAAMRQVLAWTVGYAGERVQFGRPIGKFQAVQTEIARMAAEVSASTALTDAAVDALGTPSFVLAAAAAKVRAGSAVEIVARYAHQVHGAIGFTQEHRLHHLTRRLWAWRDEAGGELAWSRVLGTALAGPQGLWPGLTAIA